MRGQRAVQLAHRSRWMLDMFDRVEEQCRADRPAPEAEIPKVLKLIDSHARVHVGSREAKPREYRSDRRKVGLGCRSCSSELDDGFWRRFHRYPFQQVEENRSHSPCLLDRCLMWQPAR